MSDTCSLEAAPVLHSCHDAKKGTKVPGEASAQNGEKRTKNAERGGVGAQGSARLPKRWRLLKSYRKVNKSSGGEPMAGWRVHSRSHLTQSTTSETRIHEERA